MKIGVVGASGRMGQAICNAISETDGATIAAGLVRRGSSWAGKTVHDVLNNGSKAPLTDDVMHFIEASDAIIDFSSPELTLQLAEKCASEKTPHIIGTTGLNEEQESALKKHASSTPIIYAPNMSVGVNVLLSITEKVAATLGSDYDIEIVEMHHKHKKDAPSGTALGLGEAAAKGRNVALKDVACKSRDGITGARPEGEIGFATLRGGDVVGEHTVIFAGNGERVEITHKASSRQIFADGAVRAALWGGNLKKGFYTMKDVLGLT